jgi:CheY-like chemotaxis protein
VATILVVEDQDAVRELIQAVLKRAGYTVLPARGAAEALQLCTHHVGAVHLIITDLVMPLMGGQELASLLIALRPEIRLLFISGYTDKTLLHYVDGDLEAPFLQKPFTPATLTEKVREALAAKSGSTGSAQSGRRPGSDILSEDHQLGPDHD